MENVMEDIEQIENKIVDLRGEKNKIKKMQERKLRLRSNNGGKSNILGRVSINFRSKLDFINDKREESGFDCLSYPKITELIITHKKYWRTIEQEIIRYNTTLDDDEEEDEFNEK